MRTQVNRIVKLSLIFLLFINSMALSAFASEANKKVTAGEYLKVLSDTYLSNVDTLKLEGKEYVQNGIKVNTNKKSYNLSSKADITYYKLKDGTKDFDGKVTTFENAPQSHSMKIRENGQIITYLFGRKFVLNSDFTIYYTETLNYKNNSLTSFEYQVDLLNTKTKQVYSLTSLGMAHQTISEDFKFEQILKTYQLLDKDVSDEFLDIYFASKKGIVNEHKFTEEADYVYNIYGFSDSTMYDLPVSYMYYNTPELFVYELFAQFSNPTWNLAHHDPIYLVDNGINELSDILTEKQKSLFNKPD
ncbi:hypothetical protein [Paenibacillus odorifer]|uniref:hypothetical protein n=1 Tax=Paenibacillus odorifer TaxID=189426 RepID=UPI00096EE29E|nr:hypothetical protein [Paenibacillus odorifer]OME27752.1 hypothetical protein BSK57_03820 [Paenibacillus odorifer]